MAGAGMNDIKARIKSVRSTMQITGAMELVATSKLRRAKEKLERTRPFCEALRGTIGRIIGSAEECSSEYIKPQNVNKTLYVVIAGDRGLAGGYNSNIFKLAKAMMAKEPSCVMPIGKKALEYYKHHECDLYGVGADYVVDVGVGCALTLGKVICEGYLSGKYDRVRLVYTKFVSMLTQTPSCIDILPLSVIGEAGGCAEYDIDPSEMLEKIVPEYVGGLVWSAVCEALASESGARRTAMNAANKNAREMVDELMLKYNRARQAVITQEITEIVSGAEAL